ncbi:hypothetical protein M2352_000117 [Azospirillum fermentarium]|uniref:hypothetical protein n=1 Tax=Azospirillum fermentarium TaxID=1233114 RepID=UPI002226A1A2|nr:hypothetical protein [Azospirillum fermentarium]MCW2244526.1 hypothetical protein [Azospirillum fermentarium]
MAAPPTLPPSVPDYRKLAAMLADLGARAADMGRDRGDQDLQRLAQRLHGYARAIQRDLAPQRGRGTTPSDGR